MPLPNRVTPLGDLVAASERGLVYGNRGCLHDEHRQIRRHHSTRRWIACQLEFRGRRRAPLMAPGRYTELFFLDESTALAAGHRPCAECRRADYNRLVDVWGALHPDQHGADAIDAQLHAERLVEGTRRRRLHAAPYDNLPEGAFVLHAGQPCLVLRDRLLTWSTGGYAGLHPRPRHTAATVITPPSLIALLDAGWSPLVTLIHPSASKAADSYAHAG